MVVGKDLHLDMAGALEILFDETIAAPESQLGLARRGGEGMCQVLACVQHPHATPAAAVGRLDDNRQSEFRDAGAGFVQRCDRPCAALCERRAHAACEVACSELVAQGRNDGGRRADPDDPCIDHRLREGGVLRQEAIARMDGIRARRLGNRKDLGGIQIGLGRLIPAQGIGFIGGLREGGLAVAFGIDGDCRHPQITGGALDPQGDLATVGDQQAFHDDPFARVMVGAQKGRKRRKRNRVCGGHWARRDRALSGTTAMTG